MATSDLMDLLNAIDKGDDHDVDIADELPAFDDVTESRGSKKQRKKRKRRNRIDEEEYDGRRKELNPILARGGAFEDLFKGDGGVSSQTDLSKIDLLDMIESIDDDDDRGDVSRLVKGEKKGYLGKTMSDEYKKEFAPELGQLYDMIQNVERLQKNLNKQYNQSQSRGRGAVTKNSNELIMNILDCDKTKLQILKEVTSIKNNVIKYNNTAKKDENGEVDAEYNANNFLAQVMNGIGRNNFIKQINNTNAPSTFINPGTNEPAFSEDDYNVFEDVDINSMLSNELGDREPVFKEQHQLFTKYAHQNPVTCVRFLPGDTDWEFVTIGDDGEIPDYPHPEKIDVGVLEFNEDNTVATARSGERYEVIAQPPSTGAEDYEQYL